MAGAVNLWCKGYYRESVGGSKLDFGDSPQMLGSIDGPFPMTDIAQVYGRDVGVLGVGAWPVLGVEVWLGDSMNQSPVSPVGDGVYGVQMRVRDTAGAGVWVDVSKQINRNTVAEFEIQHGLSNGLNFHRLELDRLVWDHASGAAGSTGGGLFEPVAKIDGRNVKANQRKSRAKRRGRSAWGKGHWQG